MKKSIFEASKKSIQGIKTSENLYDSRSDSVKQKLGQSVNGWMERNRSLVLRQTPVWAQSLIGILISLGGIVVIGGIFFKIDEVVTVQGQLKSIGGTVDVATPAGGKISEIYFEDGKFVEKGALLIKYDTTEAYQTKITLAKLVEYEEKQLIAQKEGIKSRINSLERNAKVLKKKLDTRKNISAEMLSLLEVGGYQRIQYLQQLDEIYALEAQVSDLSEQRQRLLLDLTNIEYQAQKNIDRMNSQIKSAELQLQYQNVKAPKSGIIFDPKVTNGSVLSPGERILSIVPASGLYAEVFVPNKDIGFIKYDQDTKVRVDAFPFSRYGELDAKVTQIGADALKPDPTTMNYYRYPVKLNLERDYLVSRDIKIPLKPGMSVSANLKLREKRVISLLSDMLVDQTDSIKSIRQQ